MRKINLTPNPRILQMLGQIHFENWQCIAELIDNSIDALIKDFRVSGTYDGEIRVEIPKNQQYSEGAPISIWDNGPGMSELQLENALKAGFSGNDPVSNLGLFGMGFNIATARMGDKTTVYTSQKGDSEEIGIEVDFQEMVSKNSFDRSVLTRSKDNSYTSGTTIKIYKLNERVSYLGQRGLAALKKKLSTVYSKLLRDFSIEIYVNGDKLLTTKKCIWNPDRYVVRNGESISAFIEVNKNIGDKYFCYDCWCWLDVPMIQGETPKCKVCDSTGNVKVRERKIIGWLGVQRYFDKENYGIDIYRNGRMITSNDKSFFYWKNNDTGEMEIEYPIDAAFLGGRLVGEIDANFLTVNYTKDSFEKGDIQWDELINKLRGEGPLRPDIGESYGYSKNGSPLARLYSGFRKANKPGYVDLLPGKFNETKNKWEANNVEPKMWAELFVEGKPEYQSDQKWWELVAQVEENRRSSSGNGSGSRDWDPINPETDSLSDNHVGENNQNNDEDEGNQPFNNGSENIIGEENDIYMKDDKLSGLYEIEEFGEEAILLDVYKKNILPDEKPINIEKLSHSNFKVYYNPGSSMFVKHSNTVKDIILIELANSLYLRRADQGEWPVSRIYYALKNIYCIEDMLDLDSVRERVNVLLSDIKRSVSKYKVDITPDIVLEKDDYKVLTRAVLSKLGEGDSRIKSMLQTTEFLEYMPNNYIKKFFRIYPEIFFDGTIWKRPYSEIADEDIRAEIIEEFLSYLCDIIWIIEHEDEEINSNIHRFRRNVGSLKALEEYTDE